jgi:hypothetical protein
MVAKVPYYITERMKKMSLVNKNIPSVWIFFSRYRATVRIIPRII